MRKAVKWIVLSFIFALVLPFGLMAKLGYAVLRTTEIFDMFAQMFSILPGKLGCFIRTCYYKQTLAKSHMDVEFVFGSFVSKHKATIGHRAMIAAYAIVGLADIGDETVVGPRTTVLSGGHQHNFVDPDQPILIGESTMTRLSIGKRTFIGDSCIVIANIGQNSVIGAGSVVVKDVPDYVVAVGNPARVVKERPRKTTKEANDPKVSQSQ